VGCIIEVTSMAHRGSSKISRRLLNLFLCHASADKQHVRTLCDLLVSDGVKPWLDEREILPGQDWEFEIRNALRSADIVVVCLSTRSVTKEGYVQKEITLSTEVALEKPEGAIFLVPLRLDDCTVPERLRRWQWVDFYSDGGYEKLIASCTYRARQLGLKLQRRTVEPRPGRRASVQMPKPLVRPGSAAVYPLTAGEAVRIVSGPLAGLEAAVLRRSTHTPGRVVVGVRLLQRSVAVELDVSWVVPIVRRQPK
jgi:hypothetical protein